ncbi:MAG: HAMP domain-containing sensor histidine kinase [bacterium]
MLQSLKLYGRSKQLLIILVVLVLLPLLLYSAFQINTLSEGESLIHEIYNRQLDAVLFSINQYAWDNAALWRGEIEQTFRVHRISDVQKLDSLSREFFLRNAPLRSIVFLDTSFTLRSFIHTPRESLSAVDRQHRELLLRTMLSQQRARVEKLVDYQKIGYRKLETVIVDSSQNHADVAVFFLSEQSGGTSLLTCFIFNVEAFITEALASKLNEIAGDEFSLSIYSPTTGRQIFTIGDINVHEVKESKAFWLFPSYHLAIQLREQTLEGLVKDRSRRSLLLILGVDLLVLLGAGIVFRTVKKEMVLAQLKTDFVSNVSHELRTPLSLIRMYSETLQMNRVRSDDERQEFYDTLVHESERLTRLINSILDFSRMESGNHQYRFETINLNELVQHVIEQLKVQWEQEGVSYEWRPCEGLREFSADPEALTSVIVNLLDNAVKFRAEQKWVRISTAQHADTILLEVEDHGIGIAPEHQKKIFQKFYRVSSELVHRVKGSGLGLTLVHHIVEAHHGTITLHSVPGKGSTFQLSFPVSTPLS